MPPRRRTAVELNSRKISIRDALELEPPIFKLGVVGDSEAGKTTLVNRLLQRPLPQQRTQGVGAYIAALQTNPSEHVALVDGGGEEYVQQFQVAEYADALCVVLDHNRSHVDEAVDPRRLDKSLEFQRNLRGYIRDVRLANRPLVWILVNKRDLWEKLDEQAVLSFRETIKAIEHDWVHSNLAREVVVLNHSNMIGDDVAAFHALVVRHCGREG
ncbi:GTPase domain-containing protein [Paludisphaera soli]|uniref:GTPase domain-containing protein n=1 Tax=Paludisphaera soli TaxID=2712865 RepID=UPI0013EC712A|nr:GTPase domain-containing protein [Paludisphaera soli]